MSASRVARCAALLLCLLLFGAALATVPGRPTVMDVRAGWAGRSSNGRGAKASVASASAGHGQYYDDPPPVPMEQKEVCLQEVASRDCADSWTNQLDETTYEYLGEFFGDFFDGDNGYVVTPDLPDACTDDTCAIATESAISNAVEDVLFFSLFFGQLTRGYDLVNSVWTSDFTCCDDDKDGHTAHSTVGDHVWGIANAVGSCDWMINWVNVGFSAAELFFDVEPDVGVEISSNFRKMGAASAVCYFGADSNCGGPVGERMVMSLDGQVYDVAEAYSHWAPVSTGCNVPGAPNIIGGPPGPIGPGPREPRKADKANKKHAGGPTGSESPHKEALRKFLDLHTARKANSTKAHLPLPDLREKLATVGPWGHRKHQKAPAAAQPRTPAAQVPRPSAEQASAQNYDSSEDNKVVLLGPAAVVNGIVTSMAGPHKEKWDSGVFEYVLNYDGETHNGPISPNLPWVRDKAYKFTFYKQAEYQY